MFCWTVIVGTSRRPADPRAPWRCPRAIALAHVEPASSRPFEAHARRARPRARRARTPCSSVRPGAHEAVEPEDLAGANVERHAVKTRFGPARAGSRRSLDGEHRLRRTRACVRRRGALASRAGHALARSTARRRRPRAALADDRAVAQDGDVVGDREQLLEAVRDVDDRRRRARVRSRMTSKRTGISDAVSAEVGSSIIRTRVSCTTARAISTICCCPSGSEPTRRSIGEPLAEPRERRGRGRRAAPRDRSSPIASGARGRRTGSPRPTGPETAAVPGG